MKEERQFKCCPFCGKRCYTEREANAEINDKRVLVDIKTGGRIKWHNLQLAAYAMASFENGDKVNPDRLMDLYVKKDGKFTESYINPVELPSCIKEFKNALYL